MMMRMAPAMRALDADEDGEYSAEEAAIIRPADRTLAPLERDAWLDRLDRLLASAGTDLRYRVDGLGGLEAAAFTGVLLLGYDGKQRLEIAVEAARMAVVSDAAGGTVELVLEDGVLRRSGGETTIPAAGYRVLLPAVTAETAMQTMLGMVVTR